MNILLTIAMLANLAYLAAAAAMGHQNDHAMSHTPQKRIEVTFAWKHYPVQNCSLPELARRQPERSILADDCQFVLTMITSNNGGYFELWDFDSPQFKPIVGYKSCVLAVYHSVDTNTSDYAVIGNEDVAGIIRTALAKFQNDTYVATLTGSMNCGPNNASLGILLYNGLTGDSGGPFNAITTTMVGDAWGGTTGTGKLPALPSVSMVLVTASNVTVG